MYRFERDGVTHYTNVKPRGATASQLLFSYVEACFACGVMPGVNFGTMRLNTSAYTSEIREAASKFGVEGLNQILAAELAERGVRVNAVDPGGMRTDMRAAAYPEEDPQTRITPEENTAVFLYLASDESEGVTGERFKAQEFGR